MAVTEELKDRERRNPYQSPTSGTIVRNVDVVKILFDKLFGPHRKKKIGKGSYGETFSVELTPEVKEHFSRQSFSMKSVYDSFATVTKALVKIIPVTHPDGSRSKYGLEAALRELHVHSTLSRADPVLVSSPDGRINKKYDVREFIPHVHALLLDEYLGYACIIMENLSKALTLDAFLNDAKMLNGRVTDKSILGKKENQWILYAAEKAFVCLWLSGYFHGDVHYRNVLIDPKKKRFYIIDFGRAITLSPEIVNRLKTNVSRPTGVHDFWHSASTYGNQAIYSRFLKAGGQVSSNPKKRKRSMEEGLIWHRNGDFLNHLLYYHTAGHGERQNKRRRAWGLW